MTHVEFASLLVFLDFFFCPQQAKHGSKSGFNFETEVHMYV